MTQCPQCKNDMLKKDFMNKEICYHCQYKNKLKILPKRKCKRCDCEITLSRRWKYCGEKCANAAGKEMKNSSWIKGLKAPNYNWHVHKIKV